MKKHDVSKLLTEQFVRNCNQLVQQWQNAMKSIDAEREKLNKMYGETLVTAALNTFGIVIPPLSSKKGKVPNASQTPAKVVGKSVVKVRRKSAKVGVVSYTETRDRVQKILTEERPTGNFTIKNVLEMMNRRFGAGTFDPKHVSLSLSHYLTGIQRMGKMSEEGRGTKMNIYCLDGNPITPRKPE